MFTRFEGSDGRSDTFARDASPIDFSPFVHENDQSFPFLGHGVRVLMYTYILKKEVREIMKEFNPKP